MDSRDEGRLDSGSSGGEQDARQDSGRRSRLVARLVHLLDRLGVGWVCD